MDTAAVFRVGPAVQPPSAPGEEVVETHVHATARLAEVRECGLLAAADDPAFDSVTALGQELLDVPACFVAVVDEDRDFYKSQRGFGEPLATTRELHGRTFCHYTLALAQTLVIEDTHAAAPWRDVPTVQSLGVRAYLGVPIRRQGQVVASLCAIDFVPRTWSPLQVRALHALAQSLERELALRRALADADDDAVKARALVVRGEEDAAAIAHDMGTPITVLNLALRRLTSYLQRSVPGGIDAAGRELLQHLQSASAGLLHLRDDIRAGAVAVDADAAGGAAGTARAGLSASRSLGRAERHLLPARSLLRDVHRLLEPIAQRHGVELVLGEMSTARVSIYYGRFLRVLNNIVGNALKFTPRGGTVTLSCREATADGAAVVLEVVDEGAGMTAEEVARAFDRGWQGPASLSRGDGSGLGLSIVRAIVADHGGTVTLASAGPGQGCTVRVTLPATAGDDEPG